MKKIKKNLKWITLGMVMIIIIGGLSIKLMLTEKETENILNEDLDVKFELDSLQEVVTVKDNEEVISTVYVDIKGAVQNPGVYEINEGKKVIDVVELAGGFTEHANTSLVNLAKKVTNEMVIIIYTNEEVKKAQEGETIIKIVDKQCICPEVSNDACLNQESSKDSTTEFEGKVNINQATIEELQTLTGIGESKAQAIIEYREKNGKFESIEELMEVTGIGEALYEKIKDNITI